MAGAAAGKENAAKKQKGSKGYPKGVTETGRNTIKYQARVSYKPGAARRCSAALEASKLRRRRRYR